jgi:hypothetical protein
MSDTETLQPFTSPEELVRAIQHPSYSHPIFGEAYVKHVQARLAISDSALLGTTQRTYGGATSSVDPMVGRGRIEFAAGDAEKALEISELSREVAALEAAAAVEQDRALEAVRISTEAVVEGKQAKPFEYESDMVAAFGSREYQTDERYRAAVMARVAVTDLPGVRIRASQAPQRETAQ